MSTAELQQAVAAIAEQVERAVLLAQGEAITPPGVYELLGDLKLIELPRLFELIAAGLDRSLVKHDVSCDDGEDPARAVARAQMSLAEATRTSSQSQIWLDRAQSYIARTSAC